MSLNYVSRILIIFLKKILASKYIAGRDNQGINILLNAKVRFANQCTQIEKAILERIYSDQAINSPVG